MILGTESTLTAYKGSVKVKGGCGIALHPGLCPASPLPHHSQQTMPISFRTPRNCRVCGVCFEGADIVICNKSLEIIFLPKIDLLVKKISNIKVYKESDF